MNIAYFGSPNIAAVLLKGLLSDHSIESHINIVATQPDKPAGKQLELQPTPVKQVAHDHDITIFDLNIKDSSLELESLLKKNEIELCIVYAYGGYIPSSLLSIPKYGFVNVHPSLLPSYRGPSPIAYPLILGDIETGTTIIQLNEELDGGDIISQEKITILENENRLDLEERLTKLSLTLLIEHIKNLENNLVKKFIKQDTNLVTQTRLIKKNDGFIELNILKKALINASLQDKELPPMVLEYIEKYSSIKKLDYTQNSAQLVYNLFKGLYEWPGIWTIISTSQGEKRLKIKQVSYIHNEFKIISVQLEGKKDVDFNTFNAAYKIF